MNKTRTLLMSLMFMIISFFHTSGVFANSDIIVVCGQKVSKQAVKKDKNFYAKYCTKNYDLGMLDEDYLAKLKATSEKPAALEDIRINDSIKKAANGNAVPIDGEGVKILKSNALKFVQYLSFIIMGIAFVIIVHAGFTYADSNGDPGAMQKAKMRIIAALIGMGIGFLNYAIVQLFISIVNWNLQ